MANLTLSVDDTLLRKAREAAVREHTSVNAVVREFLARYTDARERRLEAVDALAAIGARTQARSRGTWTRESLHAR